MRAFHETLGIGGYSVERAFVRSGSDVGGMPILPKGI